MTLNQPYYIDRRASGAHVSLDGAWDFFWADQATDATDESMWQYHCVLPESVYHILHKTGILSDPYVADNSKKYAWADEKVWYFRKKLTLDRPHFDGNAYLCFDGVSYYSRLWVNGTLLGDHEGMFAGPVCDIAPYLNRGGENEIVVEVKAANFGKTDSFDCRNLDGANREIVPWNLVRDGHTSNGDFNVIGIWNHIRLEFVDKLHISRPYLYTEKLTDTTAELFLECEITDGTLPELHPYFGYHDHCYSYTRAYDNGLTGKTKPHALMLNVRLYDEESGKTVYDSSELVSVPDYEALGMDANYYELSFITCRIVLENPKLWYPIGLGEPFLYQVTLTLLDAEQPDTVYDTLTFKTGIRTFEARRTAGPKYRFRWENFRFSVNGRDLFVKGVNWMPIDYLYNIDQAEYRWCLSLVKNAGIQMLRIWSGGGMPETDTFYEICDEMGILVWQDHMIANTADTHSYPQDILESQEAYNLYRIRNHPSLAVHCGGNEFNPYSVGNAASMFVLTRIMKDLDPARIFHYTTSDKGSAHIYRDMEPVWYRHIYADLPFLGESGIHSFPSYRSIRKLIAQKEAVGPLPDICSEEFRKNYPELLNHFTEYAPSRVPRMLSRISQITPLENITLEQICEASQVQAYEFYTVMIQSIRENYPNCGGILPWVFKRHWTTVGIQTVDGSGQPGYPYYALQNAYKATNVSLCIDWTVIAPFEHVPLAVTVLDEGSRQNLCGSDVTLTVYAPDFSVAFEETKPYQGDLTRLSFGEFVPDERFTDNCFLICVDLTKNAVRISRSTYFVKCTSLYENKELLAEYRSKPSPNLLFTNGPYLQACIEGSSPAKVEAELAAVGISGEYGADCYGCYEIVLRNVSDTPAYPVTFDFTDPDVRYFADDNFFLLKPGESKKVRLTLDRPAADAASEIVVRWWNGGNITVPIA